METKLSFLLPFLSSLAPLSAPAIPATEFSSNSLPLATTNSSPCTSIRRLKYQLASPSAIAEKAQVERFATDFSWQSIFRPTFIDNQLGNPIDSTTRRLRTDVEVDDVEQFMELVLNLSSYIQDTGFTPRLEVICSEGTEETIQKKVLTLKALLSYMAANELVDKRTLSCFHFYAEAPSNAGEKKELGYENIHQAALQLIFPISEKAQDASLLDPALLKAQQYFKEITQERAPLVDEMYAAYEQNIQTFQKGDYKPRIVEIAIAPITGLIRHYSHHPEWLNYVELSGYGSSNISEGIEQMTGIPLTSLEGIEAAQMAIETVEGVLNKAHKVFIYEGYLATRIQVGQNDKEPIYVDSNRMGPQTQPYVFAPLLDTHRSPLQAFLIAAKIGWNQPLEQQFVDILMKLPNGEGFLKVLRETIEADGSSFTEQNAFELAQKMLDPILVNEKITRAIRVLTNMWMNKGIQGTVSDLMVAELMGHPDLIEPSCLCTNQRIELHIEKGRINTVFVDDPALTHHYAIISKPAEGISGIREKYLQQLIREFYASLRAV